MPDDQNQDKTVSVHTTLFLPRLPWKSQRVLASRILWRWPPEQPGSSSHHRNAGQRVLYGAQQLIQVRFYGRQPTIFGHMEWWLEKEFGA